MKKRLRKKLRFGEFQEMGFQVRFDSPKEMTDDDVLDTFWPRLIDVVEDNSLEIGGSLTSFFATGETRRTVTEAQRAALGDWLRAQPEVSNVALGPLRDAWHGKFD